MTVFRSLMLILILLAAGVAASASTEVSRSLTSALAGVKEIASGIAELAGDENVEVDGITARDLDRLSTMLSDTVMQFTV